MGIDQDHDGRLYPEVYAAWRAAGGDEAYPNIAKLPQLGKWAVGFGGKKNGDRAAKLALAISIARDSDHTPNVVRNYPKFGQLLDALGVTQGGMAPAGGGLP